MPNQAGTHFYSGYQVTIATNGAIRVRAGDTISGYSAAIYKKPVSKTQSHWREFGRLNGANNAPIPLSNPNAIITGETIYHLGTYSNSPTPPPLQKDRLTAIIPLLKKPLAKCMLNKVINIRKMNWTHLDMWYSLIPIQRAAAYGDRGSQPFDHQTARYALDKMANHAAEAIEKRLTRNLTDQELVDFVDDLSNRITSNVASIRSLTRSVGQMMNPAFSAIDGWMRDQLNDKRSVLNCYRSVYGLN